MSDKKSNSNEKVGLNYQKAISTPREIKNQSKINENLGFEQLIRNNLDLKENIYDSEERKILKNLFDSKSNI